MPRKLKVAHFICDLLSGGGQRSTVDLINTTNKDVENYLILLENKKAYEVQNIKIFSIVKNKKLYKKLDFFGDYLLSKKLTKILDELEIDIVISHMEVTAKVLKFIKIPKVFYMRVDITHELKTLKDKSYLRYLKRKKVYQKIFGNQNLIAISEDTRKNISKFISTNRLETIYNPFDLEKIKEESAKTDYFDINGKYIIQIGNDIKRKRQDILLEAFSKIRDKDIKLLLLGTQKNKEILNLVKKSNIDSDRIIFHPFVANPYPFIKNAKLLVMSSEREGLPRVIVESLILKTPVVSTDCETGPREILTGELRKYLAKVNDSNDLAKKIDLALENYPEITDNYIKKFDKDRIKNRFLNYLRSVLQND